MQGYLGTLEIMIELVLQNGWAWLKRGFSGGLIRQNHYKYIKGLCCAPRSVSNAEKYHNKK